MKRSLLRRSLLIAGIVIALLLLAAGGLVLFVAWKPRTALTWVVQRMAPNTDFEAEIVRWQTKNILVLENVRIGGVFKAKRVTLSWDWSKLRERKIEELKIEYGEVFMDLSELAKLGGRKELWPATGQDGAKPWQLGRFIVERSGFVVVGLGPSVPPLTLEVEGEFDDIPLGGLLSKADLDKKRRIELRQIHIHSPLDLAVTLLKMDSITIEFRLAGLQSKELDLLRFNHPILDVDRGFFWFVEELRKTHAQQSAGAASTGPEWRVRSFQMREGRLDITRLREISVQYPFNFEATRQDLSLRDLSLAQFGVELDIPQQDMTWHAREMHFEKLRGKIAFNLGEAKPAPGDSRTMAVRPVNDVVNTLFVDQIRWRELEVSQAWLSLTFDPHSINGMFGGEFAEGYINGGVSCGWSGKDPWRFWGSAADVNAGRVSDAFSNERFAMTGRAELTFDMEGKMEELRGHLKLDSKSDGMLQVGSIRHVIERVQNNTEGLKRDFLVKFAAALKDYPYETYALEISYLKPDALLTFNADGGLGRRRLDVHWHGMKD